MKIQQSTKNIVAPKQIDAPAPQPTKTVDFDSVDLGNQARELEQDIGRMYSFYRTSNSQYEQKNLKREMLARLDSSTGTLPATQKLQDLLDRLFQKNDKAWELKGQVTRACPDTDVEFQVGKFDVAKGQPLCGDNLFNLGEWQKRKNLIPMLQPVDQKCKDVYEDIEDDLNRVGGGKPGNPKRDLGSTAEIIRNDIDLTFAQPQRIGSAKKENDFGTHLFNRLA